MKLCRMPIDVAWLALFVSAVAMEAGAETLVLGEISFEPPEPDGRIQVIQTDGTGLRVLRQVGSGLRGLAVDVDAGFLYWSDVVTDRIERVPVAHVGDDPVGIRTSGLDFPQSIGISESAGKLFWSDSPFIFSCNLDGSDPELLAFAVTTAIAVDEVNRKIYSEDRVTSALGSIVRMNFDGSDREVVISEVPTATSIAIDPVHGYVFWSSSSGFPDANGAVYRVNFDGTAFRELFVTGSSMPAHALVLDIENEHVYWGQETAAFTSDILRMGLDGGSPVVIATGFNLIGKMVLVPDSLFQIAVAIDIKPGNDRNVINPRAKGNVWVAVLADSDAGFDPLQINIDTARFGPGAAAATKHKVRDVDQDGMADLTLRFSIPEAGIASEDTAASLTGMTVDGQLITGTDTIATAGGLP